MSDRNRIEYTTQELMNLSLDNQDTDITLLRGMLQYASGLGWVRSPIAGTFPCEQYEYSSGNCIYRGLNGAWDASDDATNWVITKFTYSGTDMIKDQTRITSWTARASGW